MSASNVVDIKTTDAGDFLHDAHISGAIFGLIFIGLLDYNYYINFFNAIF